MSAAPSWGESGEVGGVELKGALEFGEGRRCVALLDESDAEAAVNVGVVGAVLQHLAELLCGVGEVAALQIELREVEARVAAVAAGGDRPGKSIGGCLDSPAFSRLAPRLLRVRGSPG